MAMAVLTREFDMSTIEQQVRKLIAQKLGLSEEQVARDASLVDDLGADSLDSIELLIEVESEFNLDVPDEDAERIHTVQQAIDYITEAGTLRVQ